MWGPGQDEFPVPRPRHRTPLATACKTRWARSIWCWRPDESAGPRAATARSSARPTARAVASTARSATSSRDGGTSATPSTASTSPASGRSTRRRSPALASTPTRCSARSTAARSRGCWRSASTRRSRCRTTTSSPAASTSSSSYVAIDFFLNDTARHADIVLPGSLHEEDEGTVTQVEGRVIKINKAVDCPGEARAGLADHPGHRHRARPAARLHVRAARARSSKSCAIASKGGVADYSGITYEKIERADGRVLALLQPRPADRRSPRPTTRARRGCSSRAATTRSPRARARSISPTARPDSTSPTTAARRRCQRGVSRSS